MRTLIVALILLGLGGFSKASIDFRQDSIKQRNKLDRFEAGAPIISPLIIPTYAPEIGTAISAGALLSFKTRRNNSYLGHSILPFIAGINTKGDFYVRTRLSSMWLDDNIKFTTYLKYENIDDNYWGVGYENGKNTVKSDGTTGYRKKWFFISPALYVRILDQFYAGVKVDFNKTVASEINENLQADKFIRTFGTDILNMGIGISLLFDSRDLTYSPWKGIYLNFDGIFYGENFGGQYTYQTYIIDYRQYKQILRYGSTLSWQFKTRYGLGEIPWTDMSTFNTTDAFRGYYYGRYRDNSMAMLLLEYRHYFNKMGSTDLSKHGAIFWFGGGTIFDNVSNVKDPLFSVGIGYRYTVQPRMNVRIDIGFGEDSWGLYLGFTEAF